MYPVRNRRRRAYLPNNQLLPAHRERELRSRDAGRFLDRIFGCEFEAEGYFEDYYEDRIKIVHPASQFGVFPGAALGVDDVWFLRRTLIHLYDFLVTGNVKEDMKWKPKTATHPE